MNKTFKLLLPGILATSLILLMKLNGFAALSAEGKIEQAHRVKFVSEQNTEIEYTIKNISTNNEEIGEVQIVIPNGFYYVNVSTPQASKGYEWRAEYANGIITLLPQTSYLLEQDDIIITSVYVNTKDIFQPATEWPCIVYSTFSTSINAVEVATDTDSMKVSIVVYSIKGSVDYSTLLPGATTTVTAQLLDDYGVPLVNRTINFSIINGNGQIITLASPNTNTEGRALITFQAGSVVETNTIKFSYMNKVTGIVNINVKDNLPLIDFGKLSYYRDNLLYVKPQTPIVLTSTYSWSVQYRIDSNPWQVYVEPFYVIGFSDGLHTIYYRHIDQSGTTGETLSVPIYVLNFIEPQKKFYCYPNPFSAGKEETILEYYLDTESGVTIEVFDLLGQRVWSKNISSGEPGALPYSWNQTPWKGRNELENVVSNGGYICRVTIDSTGKKYVFKLAVIK